MPPRKPKSTVDIRHTANTRSNLPSAEDATTMSDDDRRAEPYYYQRNRDLDPQLVWRGKDIENDMPLEVMAPPIYVQERIRPKHLIDDLRRHSDANPAEDDESQAQMFADFNGLPSPEARTEYYQHQANWSNRMILGDSLQVMASLAEKEGMKGQVQCIYMDPPYGINFSSNWQWSTNNRAVGSTPKDITREPEQIRAFRDTWRDGINSYLSYLRDRLVVARELLTDSGSIFVQIGEENSHRVRAMMDEVFGDMNFVTQIYFATTSGFATSDLSRVGDYLIWYSRNRQELKFRNLFVPKGNIGSGVNSYRYLEFADGSTRPMTQEERNGTIEPPSDGRVFRFSDIQSRGSSAIDTPVEFQGKVFNPLSNSHWKASWPDGMRRIQRSGRLSIVGRRLTYRRYSSDYPVQQLVNAWMDTGFGYAATEKMYVVQTHERVVQRCILMTSDPGDLVLDPTCGAGTSALVSEQYGRRWITIDTSRVALALAMSRLMGTRLPHYVLTDSEEGVAIEIELGHGAVSKQETRGDIRQGFVYQRVPHITLGDISKNTEIDVIWERFQEELEPLRELLNEACGTSFEEWEIPREADPDWSDEARLVHAEWWEHRLARQREIDASIAANADFEYLYDKPYEDSSKVRVAGPFTVESVSPHRMLPDDADDEDASTLRDSNGHGDDYTSIILENLRVSGVQQAHKEDRITFSSIEPWAGPDINGSGTTFISAQGQCNIGDEGESQRAAIFIGPEFGTVMRVDLIEAAREASESGFDMLVACAFQYDAMTTEMSSYGRITVLQARMNADLHMATDLKPSPRANLFVVFGEPDIELLDATDGKLQVKIRGVDVFDPTTGEVRSDNTDGIAMWFIDTDYNSECFFVRHAYFLGAQDPYERLKTSLKAEINLEAWESLHSDTSRPFETPSTGRIAVKVINHLGDEVMKVLRVPR